MKNVMIVRTGLANMASVQAAFVRLGMDVEWTTDPAAVRSADRLVLPGVGSYAPAMRELDARELIGVLRERIDAGRPTLAICLGLQLLATGSDEDPGVDGLSCFAGQLERFDDGLIVPHLGWNEIVPDAGCRLLQPGSFYYANSYRLTAAPAGWQAATSEYGGSFVGALERGDVLACQFHPELSGADGASLLERWLEQTGGL